MTLNWVIQLPEFSNSTDHKIIRPVVSWRRALPRNLSSQSTLELQREYSR